MRAIRVVSVALAAVVLWASFPTAAQLAAKPDAALVKGAGLAAYDAIQEITDPAKTAGRQQLLIDLATAQVAAGDLAGARGTLSEARAALQPKDYRLPDLLILSVRVGDRRGGLEALQRMPDEAQFLPLEKLASAQLKDGDLAGAEATLGLIEALQAKSPHDVFYGRALSELGKAFAARGDLRRAQALARKITNKPVRVGLLSEIAKAQHKAGDRRGVGETLKELREDVAAAYEKDPIQSARLPAYALAFSGDLDGALDAVAAMQNKGARDLLYSQLADSLARSGDIAAARRIADATGNPDTLILIGELQQGAGRCDEARATLAAGVAALQRSSLPRIDQSIRVQRAVDTLIKCGAFAEAVTLSQRLDELNRPPALLRAIKEEAKRGDAQALQATIPIAIDLARTAATPDLTNLGELVAVLVRAGRPGDAKTVLHVMQGKVSRLTAWQLVDGLNAVRRAELALGDKDGAARTQKVIADARDKFIAELTAAQGTSNAHLAKAIELLIQLEEADDAKAEQALLKEVMNVLGSDGQAFIQLMAIAARFSAQAQKNQAVNEAIAGGDLAAAQAIIETLPGRQRNASSARLGKAQIAAGQFQAAFDTARALRDPMQRAGGFIAIIQAAGKA